MADIVLGSPYQPGDVVPFHLIPWIVVLSFFASFVGCLTTVELLHRRITTGKRWLSMLQLFACSVSMGLVGIWCMHFVGNRAIILANGQVPFQLVYSPGFTAVSVFLPIIFLFIGFSIADRESQKHRNRARLAIFLTIAGVAAGLSIVGMHYVGNFGIMNYKLEYSPKYIGGAIIVAVVDASGALVFFFSMKELWINNWWSRLVTAIFLAVAVSGMHWVASVGVKYSLKKVPAPDAGNGRNINLIIAVALSAAAFLACVGIVYYARLRKRKLADRAQQVVLACAIFDPEGRLMVTQEGLLPNKKITRQFSQRSFDDEFNVAHPVFQWIYRVTYNWGGVADLVAGMRTSLRWHATGWNDVETPSANSSVWEYEGEMDYSLLFRESFCVAASDLAQELQVPLESLGVLYDDIMMTGTTSLESRARRTFKTTSGLDLEAGLPMVFGKGQLLFVVRQASKLDASRLTSIGYRFAAMSQVGEIISRSMQVPISEFAMHVDRLRDHCRAADIPSGTKYLACYALRTKASQKGFDILVPKASPDQLPKVELPLHQLQPWQLDILGKLDGRTVRECLSWLNSKQFPDENLVEEEEDFKDLMYDRISALTTEIGEGWFYQAVFCSKPFTAHYTNQGNDSLSQVTLFAFCIIPDVHNCSLKALSGMTYTPFSFFKTRQRVYKNSPDHSSMARQIHHEFAPILHRQKELAVPKPTHSRSRSRPSFWQTLKPMSPRSSSLTVKPDNSSERELVKMPSNTDVREVVPTPPPDQNRFPFGGILVSSDTVVDSDKMDMLEMRKMGTTALVSAEKEDREASTFADQLYTVTSTHFRHNVQPPRTNIGAP
ncbi:MAG: hypothetical protein M1820_000357 [Bogoriella megaspora]|nr:MAG: hypothetical protein M1820_000357 [Bogoriella megaspora]